MKSFIVKNRLLIIVILILLPNINAKGQNTLPIYSDYLTDNIYLLHPAGAGISNYGKIRLTGRKQWLNYDNAPELQTLSVHSHLGKNTALGLAFFNDKNGHFSQVGGQITYAYHIKLDNYQTNQFSFGISLLAIRNTLDGRDYEISDSDVTAQILSRNYYNSDVSIAYRYEGLFSLYTIKNLLLTPRNLYANQHDTKNLRRHLFSLGYLFNKQNESSVKIQPSILFHYIEETEEANLDTNIKFFVPFNNGEIWSGISYRRSLDQNSIQATNHLTPFLGIKFKNYIVSYSYTSQQNKVIYNKGGFHQITLGFNFFADRYTRKASWDL